MSGEQQHNEEDNPGPLAKLLLIIIGIAALVTLFLRGFGVI